MNLSQYDFLTKFGGILDLVKINVARGWELTHKDYIFSILYKWKIQSHSRYKGGEMIIST